MLYLTDYRLNVYKYFKWKADKCATKEQFWSKVAALDLVTTPLHPCWGFHHHGFITLTRWWVGGWGWVGGWERGNSATGLHQLRRKEYQRAVGWQLHVWLFWFITREEPHLLDWIQASNAQLCKKNQNNCTSFLICSHSNSLEQLKQSYVKQQQKFHSLLLSFTSAHKALRSDPNPALLELISH